MLRKPASVVSSLNGSAVFVAPVQRMISANPDKSEGEALVAECGAKSFCLENSLLAGFSPSDFLAAARKVSKVWSFDRKGKLFRPSSLVLIPASRRSGEAARASQKPAIARSES